MPSLQLTAVADKGSTDRCDGEDWVALDNTGTAEIALAGYVLHDDKGPDDSKAYTFAADATIAAGATTTLCKDAAGSFEFGIGGDDTVTLLDAGRVLVDSSGQLGDQGALNHVWTRAAPGTWAYQVLGTLEPTPAPSPSAPDHSWGTVMDAMCSAPYDENASPDLDTSQYPVLCASIETHDGFTIVNEPKVPATLVIGTAGTVLYNGVIGIEIRGQASSRHPKKQYGFETWSSIPGPGSSQYGYEDLDVSLVGLPKDEDWIIQGPFLDDALVRNVFTYNIARATGMYAARTRYCVLSINGVFKGVYILMEKLKRGPGRIDIARNDDASGGWIVKIDKGCSAGCDHGFTTSNGTRIQFDYPKAEDLTRTSEAHIKNYINMFEARLLARSPTYAALADVDSFAHYFLLTELSSNIDGYRISTWLHKDRGGRLKMGPVWDYDCAWGDAPFLWRYWKRNPFSGGGLHPVPFWWSILVQEQSFQDAVRVRWAAMRASVLSPGSVDARIDGYIDLLGADTIRADADIWYDHDENAEEIQKIKDYCARRVDWMDGQIASMTPTWGRQTRGPTAAGETFSPTGPPTPAPTLFPTPPIPPTQTSHTQAPSAAPVTGAIAPSIALAVLSARSGCSANEGHFYVESAADCAMAAARVLGGSPSVRVIISPSKLPGCYYRSGARQAVTFNDAGDTAAVHGGTNKQSICLRQG